MSKRFLGVDVFTAARQRVERIGEELGMDRDEVLRLKQITGLAEAFKDREFSEAWD